MLALLYITLAQQMVAIAMAMDPPNFQYIAYQPASISVRRSTGRSLATKDKESWRQSLCQRTHYSLVVDVVASRISKILFTAHNGIWKSYNGAQIHLQCEGALLRFATRYNA